MRRTRDLAGERELTGSEVRRRVRQRGDDSDLERPSGWSVEVKRHKAARRTQVAACRLHATQQVVRTLPVPFYRPDRGASCAVWPLAVLLDGYWGELAWTADNPVEVLVPVARALPNWRDTT